MNANELDTVAAKLNAAPLMDYARTVTVGVYGYCVWAEGQRLATDLTMAEVRYLKRRVRGLQIQKAR